MKKCAFVYIYRKERIERERERERKYLSGRECKYEPSYWILNLYTLSFLSEKIKYVRVTLPTYTMLSHQILQFIFLVFPNLI